MFKITAAAALILVAISSNAMAGNMSGMSQGILDAQQSQQQQQINDQWMAMSRAWINCVNQGGGTACGPAPQAPQQYQPAPRQYRQPVPNYDFKCVSDCSAKGYLYQLCLKQCQLP